MPRTNLCCRLILALIIGVAGCGRNPEVTAESSTSRSTTFHGNGFVVVDLALEAAPLSVLLQREQRNANRLGLRTFVEFGAPWCKPCVKLRAAMKQEPVASAMRGMYVVAIDVDQWGARLGEGGFTISAVPVLVELDEQARPTERRIDGQAFGDDSPDRMAKAMREFVRR